MLILKAEQVAQAAELLRAGELVAMPTETVYGLAGDALRTLPVSRIFAAKGRPSFDPLIVHGQNLSVLDALGVFNPRMHKLASLFWPGPLTLLAPRRRDLHGAPAVPDLVTAGLDEVGLRVPAHPTALALLHAFGGVLAAPSANRFGAISPVAAQDVVSELAGQPHVAAVLDGGSCPRGLESTVVRCPEVGAVEILRLGALSPQAIAAALQLNDGELVINHSTSRPGAAVASPGMVERHYAPKTPLVLASRMRDLPSPTQRTALLVPCGNPELPAGNYVRVECLSLSSDSVEAASRLFATLRELDAGGYAALHAVMAPPTAAGGLGPAINDRLRRAAAR